MLQLLGADSPPCRGRIQQADRVQLFWCDGHGNKSMQRSLQEHEDTFLLEGMVRCMWITTIQQKMQSESVS